jgi:GH15 family glucan-1,4-alpha-glucosidase
MVATGAMARERAAEDEWLAGVADRAAKLILGLQDPSGAYPASPTFSAYQGFCWFRDGSFIADAMSASGHWESAAAFHRWSARALEGWRERVDAIQALGSHPEESDLVLPARLRLDGTEVPDEWANHQVDGIGTWLWALRKHLARTGGRTAPWRAAVEVAVDYLLSVGTRPCYDWWEERPVGVHPSTLACVGAGLRSASEMGVLDVARFDAARGAYEEIVERLVTGATPTGYLPKTEGSQTIDAAAIAAVGPLRVVRGELGQATLRAVEAQLVDGAKVYRFTADRYYGGGPWPLLSAMLGLAWLEYGREDRARELLEWAASTEDVRGWIPEQGRGHLLHPDGLAEWEHRWGKSATPLLWSSAMVLRLHVALT